MVSRKVKQNVGKALSRLSAILEKCGGPGSGVPGPCPSGVAEKPGRQTSRHPVHPNDPDAKRTPKPFVGKPVNPSGKNSYKQFRNADGSWTPERQQLHNQIIRELMAKSKATPVAEPVAYLMGGGSAAGKSVAMNSGKMDIPKNIVIVDADEIKMKLPEYHTLLASGGARAAAFVHDESSYLSKRLLDIATQEKKHTLLDGTGNTSLEKLSAKMAEAKAAGRRVEANYVTVDTTTAMKRSQKRMRVIGRGVPQAVLKRTHEAVSQIVPEAIKAGIFDVFRLFDTNTDKPVLVASAEGTKLVVHNENLWRRFLKKAPKRAKRWQNSH